VHHRYDENSDDYDMDMDQRTRSFGSLGGRIILLSDGTEVSHDHEDTEMFDNDDEERDLVSQVSRVHEIEDGDEDDHEEGGKQEETSSSKTAEAPATTGRL
jgi:protein phosphatase 2C family protein 2/3